MVDSGAYKHLENLPGCLIAAGLVVGAAIMAAIFAGGYFFSHWMGWL